MLVIRAHPWQKLLRGKEYVWVKSNGSDAEFWQQKPTISQEEKQLSILLTFLSDWKAESKKLGSLPPSPFLNSPIFTAMGLWISRLCFKEFFIWITDSFFVTVIAVIHCILKYHQWNTVSRKKQWIHEVLLPCSSHLFRDWASCSLQSYEAWKDINVNLWTLGVGQSFWLSKNFLTKLSLRFSSLKKIFSSTWYEKLQESESFRKAVFLTASKSVLCCICTVMAKVFLPTSLPKRKKQQCLLKLKMLSRVQQMTSVIARPWRKLWYCPKIELKSGLH